MFVRLRIMTFKNDCNLFLYLLLLVAAVKVEAVRPVVLSCDNNELLENIDETRGPQGPPGKRGPVGSAGPIGKFTIFKKMF